MSAPVALWCKSHFSFLEGASAPDELVSAAADAGLSALALTDRDSVGGLVRAWTPAKERGLPLLSGAQVTLADDSTLVLLAMSRVGYGRLCRLLTLGRRRAPKGTSSVTWAEVAEHAADLVALWGGDRALPVREAQPPDAVAHLLREAFGDRLYALVARHRRAGEVPAEARLRARARRYDLPLVAAVEVLYHHPDRRPLQDVLTCVRHGVTLSTAGRHTRPNAEHALPEPGALRALFADDPAALERTAEVAARCRFTLDDLRYRYPAERLPDGRSASDHLRHLTLEGARGRFPRGVPPAIRAQIDKELALIEALDYGGYFLTMHELVQFCRSQAILCQGRGSAANSVVCYCLGVTAVDPRRVDLLFERFLSRERAEPPDIDLDIAHERREEVIQHVYARYGREHAAMVANVIRYRPRSAVRDVGKALGLPATTLDQLARRLSSWGSPEPDALRALLPEVGLDPHAPAARHLVRLTGELLDCPRHLSIHPGGFLLGHEPVCELVPIENATMEGRTVIQWDKYDVEALGLFKVDLLGLGALTMVDACLRLVEAHDGVRLDLATLPDDDPATYDMICAGDTVGTFQIESRAQMSMLPRLRPRAFYDLVIQISIVRPGPITGGMVHPYLRRRQGEEAVVYPHPSLEPVLRKTLGIPLFQEQVMKLAVVAADYTPGEADQLRRDMAAWRSAGRIEAHRARLIERMVAKGIERRFAEQVFDQIRGFGEYGFPESHAASFALIAYATAYLKRHHPAAFLCALLNAQPMGFYDPNTLIGEAQRGGLVVRPVDARRSDWDCTLEPLEAPHPTRHAVRLGLSYLKGLSRAEGDRVLAQARRARTLTELVRGSGLSARTLRRLAESGALAGYAPDRRAALWEIEGLAGEQGSPLPLAVTEPTTPALTPPDWLTTIAWDHATGGHSVRGHPLAPLREHLRDLGLPTAAELNTRRHGSRCRYAGLVICRQRPDTAAGVTFMTLEDETGFVNLVLWQQTFSAFARLARTETFLGVTGRLQREGGVVHLVATHLWEPPLHATHRPSRDFH